MKKPLKRIFGTGAFVLCALIAKESSAQWNYEVVASFAPPDYVGASPNGLVQGRDGTVYGTTYIGGRTSQGTIFKVGSNGLEVVLDFGNAGAYGPHGTLIVDTNGAFLGTTTTGGSAGEGTIFKWDTSGFNILYSFGNLTGEGIYPYAGVLQARDGLLYGTTEEGGTAGYGTVWKLDGTSLSVLHSFTGRSDADGANPWAGLIQAADGSFYGTTLSGGDMGLGTVFRGDASGFAGLFDFRGISEEGNYEDGSYPYASLIQARDGAFYGTTANGGRAGGGTIFTFGPKGYAILHHFNGEDGAIPLASLIQGSDGAFYGTTANGGKANLGTVFKFDGSGLTVLHEFTGLPDGAHPGSELLLARDGSLYGTTSDGGSSDVGTVYRLFLNAPPNDCDTDTTAPELGAVPAAGPFVLGSGSQNVGPIAASDNCQLDMAQCVLSGTVDTSTVGTKTVDFRAVDLKGNASVKSAEYKVVYAPTGTVLGQPTRQMLAPMKAGRLTTVKQGSTVPLKFRVADANGHSVGPQEIVADFRLVARQSGVTRVSCNEVPVSTNHRKKFVWDADERLWQFNLSTKDLLAGWIYLYRINLNDGSSINFQLEVR